jgi:aminoglycoside phosphotransferase (APT) family kinase protein
VGDRSSQWHLDERVVAGLVASQFPDLAGAPVSRLGAGWDHELFAVGAEWILRFPRRQERVAWLLRERAVVALAAQAAGGMVPVFELAGKPAPQFPAPFVGYRRLPGVGAGQAGRGDLAGLAAGIGTLLGALHRIDPDRVPPTPDGWESEPWDGLRTELSAAAGLARPLLSPGLRQRAGPYLDGLVPAPPQDGQRRFVHNDICPDHVLVDPGTGLLTGLIDFTDAMVGDPVLDFAGLIGIGGYPFIGQVTRHYGLPLSAGFRGKLEWLSRMLTLTWLADAAATDPAAVPSRLSWVAHAFGTPPAP